MTLLLIASRYHEADPGRGPAVQALGLCRALRRLGQPVVFFDPFESTDGTENPDRIAETLAADPPRGVVAVGTQRPGWCGWWVLAEHLRRHRIPMVTVDVTDAVCLDMGSARFASWRDPDTMFLPPAVDPELYDSSTGRDRDLVFTFVGRLTPARREALSHLQELPGFVHDSGIPGEPRIPRHSLAGLLARSLVGIDLPGERIGAVHGRIFEALAAGAHAVTPWSEELAECLEPGREVLAYQDSGEMVGLVRQLHTDPKRYRDLLAAGRKRVLDQHSFDARARSVLVALAERCLGDIPAEAVQQPKVTIYMPVCNGARHLSQALDGILGQTWRNLHVLALDDASTDCTLDILHARAARDSRLQVVHYETGRGNVVRRNDALRQLPDDTVYLGSHDASDVSEPTRIQRLVEFLEQNPIISHVGCHARVVDAAGNLRDYLRLPTDPDEIDRTIHEVNPLLHSAALYRRSVLGRLSGYRNVYRSADDYDFWGRAVEAGYRLANVPEPLVRMRVRDDISSTDLDRQERLCQRIGGRLFASLPWRLAHREGKDLRMRAVLHGVLGTSEGHLRVDGTGVGADIDEDFHFVRLPPGCLSELWVHHCLEQVPRVTGLRMLIEWHLWLQEKGQLVIETTDLKTALDRLHESDLRQSDLLRHLFGGQAAGAAAHHDAYDEARLREQLTRLGFTIEGITHIDRDGLPFIIAQCRKHSVSAEEQGFAALDLLEDFLVDTAEVDVRFEWHRQLIGEPSRGDEECAS